MIITHTLNPLISIKLYGYKLWGLRIIFCILFYSINITESHSQVDSLFAQYLEEKEEISARNIMKRIQGICQKNLDCYQPIVIYLDDPGMDDKKSQTYSYLISAFNSSLLYVESINLAMKAIQKVENFNKSQPALLMIYNSLALNYGELFKVDSSLIFANKSEKLAKKLGRKDFYWRPDYARFNAYESINKTDLSYEYLKKSYAHLKDGDDRMNKGFILFLLLKFSKTRNLDEDFDSYLKEYVQFNKEAKKPMDVIHQNLFQFFKDDEGGIKILEDKLKRIEEETGKINHSLKIEPLSEKMKLLDLYSLHGQNDKALTELKKLIQDTFHSVHILNNSYVRIIDIYSKLNLPDSALAYSKKYNNFLKVKYEKNFEGKIADYEVKYQTQEKEKELFDQKLMNTESKLKLQTSYGMILGLGAIIILTILFFRNKIKNQKLMLIKEQELQEQRIKKLEQDNKLLALNSMIEGQEAERLRIAHDLHDGLGGLLTTVKAHFAAIEREIDAVKSLNVFDKTNDLIDKACIEVRRIAHNMVPHSIQISGLYGALQDLNQSIKERGLDCELDLHNIEKLDISQQVASMIYRILQEVTNNCIKHAEASKILIQLIHHDNILHIMIEDNGKGFDINEVVQKNGLGLKSIDSRIKYLNGKVHYDTSPFHGTIVNIEIPLLSA